MTAGNEEDKIAACLQSLTWCDEIVVVDSYSTDRTPEISRTFTDKVFQHEWGGYIAQKNFARGLATHPWILFVDADEVVSPGLRAEVEKLFAEGVGDVVGFRVPRMVNYLGKWIRHGEWYPDMKLRLFLKDKGYSGGEEPHDRVVVDGPVKNLRHPLYHYTYDNVTDHLDTLNRFSSISALQKDASHMKFSIMHLLFRPMWRFFRAYFIKLGFLDGIQGLIIAGLSSYGVMIKYAKLYEIQKQNRPQGQQEDL